MGMKDMDNGRVGGVISAGDMNHSGKDADRSPRAEIAGKYHAIRARGSVELERSD